jgi:hypothetical protein
MRRLNRAFVLKRRSLGTVTLWLSSANDMVTGSERTEQRPIKCNPYKFAEKKYFLEVLFGVLSVIEENPRQEKSYF